MRLMEYLRDHIAIVILHLLGMVFLTLFLLSAGNSVDTVGFVLLLWTIAVAGYLGVDFYRRRCYLVRLLRWTEELTDKYLIAEIMEKPVRADDRAFYRILKMANKSMLERITAVEHEKKAYQEQIEQWVHETKTPITAIRLLCENNPTAIQKPILLEVERLNHSVEQVLYFARIEHTEKDYLVREIVLEDMVHQSIAQNKQLLLQNHIQLRMESCDSTVYTDEKWIVFILSQLLNNAVKYKSDDPVISFRAEKEVDRVLLSVTDNGIGILPEDLPRIFDKGFTGKNGREGGNNATGMGLYLCRCLCERLGVGLEAISNSDRTTFTLVFFQSRFVDVR